ncbi:MAG: mechanosensitive ion channel domain-containing protein [Pseudomonadota bacterium]
MTRIVTAIFVLLALVCGAMAQDAPSPPQDALAVEVDTLIRSVDTAVGSLPEIRENDEALLALSKRLSDISERLVTKGVEITTQLTETRTNLDQLGAVPETGEDLFADERSTLNARRAELNRFIGQLEQASVRARTGINAIAEARRDVFASTLSRRFEFSTVFGSEFANDVSGFWRDVARRIQSWATFTLRTKQESFLGAIVLSLLVALGGSIGFRKAIRQFIFRDTATEQPVYFDRLIKGFFYALIPSFLTLGILALAYGIFEFFGVWRGDIARLAGATVVAVLIVVLIWRLSEAMFSPSKGKWRIVEVSDRAASLLKILVIALAAVSAVDLLITQINTVVGNTLSITVAKSLFTAILTGSLLLAISFVKPYGAIQTDEDVESVSVKIDDLPWPRWFKWFLIGAGLLLILSALAGYIGFARFASQQIVITGAILTTAFVGLRASQAVAERGVLSDRTIGRFLRDRFKSSDAAIDQAGLILALLLGLVIVLIALPAIALIWGFDVVTIRSWFTWFFTGISIGSITISLTGIAAGIALFAFGFWLTKRVQKAVDRNVLERGRVEIGARTSIRTAIGYVGVALAALVGVSAAGINLSQLAFIAGALSLGIGFGLQNIVSNFVSGLILLAERPFKTGDVIEAGGFTGVVKNVNVRATEVELFDKKTVVVPNSELINSPVSNWMHRNTLARMEIPIGVAYGTDPKLVIDTLVGIAEDHPRVLSVPEPFVAFTDFGASSLDFVLYAYIADVSFGLGTRTELRLEIDMRFKALNIEIPFPQRDVNLKMMPVAKEDAKSEDEPVAAPEFDVIRTSKVATGDDEDD